MPNPYFQFKQFTVHHDRCAMKVTTDACLFGAWLARMLPRDPGFCRGLDIGAGSGLLTLMVAQQHPDINFTAVEIDAEAAAQAGENFTASPWAQRMTLVEADILKYTSTQPFDFVFSNPPFHETQLRSNQAGRNLAHHSEALTLEQLVTSASNLLRDNGLFFVLAPAYREGLLLGLLKERAFTSLHLLRVKQTPRHPTFRVMVMARKGKSDQPMELKEISIAGTDGAYMPLFAQWLAPYYLKL